MSKPNDSAPEPEDWARILGAGWEKRARSPSRDFFVASFEDWDDPEVWERIARQEIELMLAGLDPEWLKQVDVLEIGCGSGRLTPFLLEQVRSYTGFDIAPGMVEAARERCSGVDNARFFVGDGLSVPAEAANQKYGLVLTLAVFIHCPKNVIERNLSSAWEQVAPGGQLRFQVLGDPNDPTGVVARGEAGKAEAPPVESKTEAPTRSEAKDEEDTAPASAADSAVAEEAQAITESRSEEEVDLAKDEHYMGHPFGYEETRETVARCTPGSRIELYRGHLYAIYGMASKDA